VAGALEKVTTALFGAGRNATPTALVLQGDKIVVGGSVDGNFALARFTADLDLDSTFGGDGTVETDIGGADTLNGLAIQPDRKMVAAGQTGSDVALARYGTTTFVGTTSVSPSLSEPGGIVTASASGVASASATYVLKMSSREQTCRTSPLVLGGSVVSTPTGEITAVSRTIPVSATSGVRWLCWVSPDDADNDTKPAKVTIV
jgi:hypothetical protein